MLHRLFGAKPDVPEVNVAEAQQRQAQGALMLDVREPEEWASGHVPGATHIPLGELGRRLADLPRDRELLTVCARGNRSARAAELLQQAGYGRVASVSGGIVAWAERGLPVVVS